jgi:hypothetical protein
MLKNEIECKKKTKLNILEKKKNNNQKNENKI